LPQAWFDQRISQAIQVIRFLVLLSVFLCGCEGMKVGGGYKFDTREFFLQIERPLDPSLKK
jgi:hypothetical protein